MYILRNFINEYQGKTGQGNTIQNKGECVGLVELYIDELHLSHIWGNGKDLFANADPSQFQKVENNPSDTTQFPPVGAIIVWGETWGNGFGHCGIVTDANGESFVSFEQNDLVPSDPNGACAIVSHPNYEGVTGWLIPNVQVILDEDPAHFILPSGHEIDLTNIESAKQTAILWDAVVNLGEYEKKT